MGLGSKYHCLICISLLGLLLLIGRSASASGRAIAAQRQRGFHHLAEAEQNLGGRAPHAEANPVPAPSQGIKLKKPCGMTGCYVGQHLVTQFCQPSLAYYNLLIQHIRVQSPSGVGAPLYSLSPFFCLLRICCMAEKLHVMPLCFTLFLLGAAHCWGPHIGALSFALLQPLCVLPRQAGVLGWHAALAFIHLFHLVGETCTCSIDCASCSQ